MGSKPTTLVAFQQRSSLKLFEVQFAANVEIRAFIFMRFHPSPPLFPPPLLLLHPFIFSGKRIHLLPRGKQKTVCPPKEQLGLAEPKRRVWVGVVAETWLGGELGEQRDTGGRQSTRTVARNKARTGLPLLFHS